MIADLALARRIEGAEARLAIASVSTNGSASSPAGDVLTVAGGVAVFGGVDSPGNKVIGLGLSGPATSTELDALEAFYQRHGSAARVELCPLAHQALAPELSRRGFRLEGFENVLAASASCWPAPVRLGDGVEIVEAEPGGEREWALAVASGFSSPETQSLEEQSFADSGAEALADVLAPFFRTPGIRCFVARVDGHPVAGAAMRIDEGLVALFGAGVAPTHRRRGLQSAMLARRLAIAADAHCDLAVTTTLPGSTSQRNVERAGFRPVYTRAVLIKEMDKGLEARG